MHTKLGQLLSTLIIVGLALFWSASILAADNTAADMAVDAAQASVVLAADANAEAAENAVKSIAEETKVELDRIELEIRVIDPNSLRVAAD